MGSAKQVQHNVRHFVAHTKTTKICYILVQAAACQPNKVHTSSSRLDETGPLVRRRVQKKKIQ